MAHRLTVLLLLLIALSSSLAVTPSGVRVGEGVMADHLEKRVAPAYPPLAKQAHIQGKVVLEVRISKSGDVLRLQLISGHPMLAPAAVEAVKQWKYTPFLLNGDPVEVETNVMVNFTLSDKPAAGNVAGDHPGDIPVGEPVPPRPAVPQHVRVSSSVMQGLIVTKVQPQYPSDAARIQGMVVLKAIIDKEGNVSNLQLISGHPLLAPAAIEAVKQWKYKPFELNGTPVEVETQVQVNFTLAN